MSIRSSRKPLVDTTPSQPTHADEQWSPATTDLIAGLPDLIATMHSDGFELRRVMYNPADWDSAVPKAAVVAGRTIKLGAFNYVERGSVTVIDDDGRSRVTLRLPESKRTSA